MDQVDICYSGLLGGPRSMGRVGQFFLEHLLSDPGYRVHFSPIANDYMAPYWEDRFKKLVLRSLPAHGIDQLVTFCSVLDAQRPRWARLMTPWLFYELNSLPSALVQKINTNDFTYTVSSFVRQVFLQSGVTTPVKVMAHGFDPAHFHYVARSVHGKFTFLCVAEHTPRKNLPALVRSFERAFQDQDAVQLVLKLGVHGEGDLRQYITRPDKVLLATRKLAGDAQMAQLYRSAHCFVLPTRSEGFGMPVLEAMATGLPVIVTDYSGHLDFCNNSNAYLIRNAGMVDSDPTCFPYVKSQWAQPDEEHLIHLMRQVFDDYDAALRMGLAARHDVAQDWTWEQQLSRHFPLPTRAR